ncbi:hypothetical protein HMPREF3190_01203 [Umbribacter vaginalis]|nr:hypothetical protein HMPREF3190_01203 [Coriobacteriales bacterium DNF00809]
MCKNKLPAVALDELPHAISCHFLLTATLPQLQRSVSCNPPSVATLMCTFTSYPAHNTYIADPQTKRYETLQNIK